VLNRSSDRITGNVALERNMGIQGQFLEVVKE